MALKSLSRWYQRFLFESCSPETCAVLRILYALLLIVYTLALLPDAAMWFGDSGVLSSTTAQLLVGDKPSIFFFLPASNLNVQLALVALLSCATALLLGFTSRLWCVLIFVLLTSLQHRNPLICDGEDTVFRLFAFYLLFLPCDARWSLSQWWHPNQVDRSERVASAWGLRLVQMQMVVLYSSAAWSKWLGESWRDGSAVYYVFQMSDLFGRGPLPDFITHSELTIRLLTWGVLVVEAAIPLCLLWRRTRWLGLLLGFALHLSLEYAMHLFLFQWIMMLGLLAFVDFGPNGWRRFLPRRRSLAASRPRAAAVTMS